MFRTILFVLASALLLAADHLLQRHGATAVPRWVIPVVWVVLALWARVDDDGIDPGTQSSVRMVVLPVAAALALVFGLVGWALRDTSLLGVVGMALLPGGVALLLWWVVELVRGRR